MSGYDIAVVSNASPTSTQVMNAFYRRIFPYKAFFKWLNQAESKQSCRRVLISSPGEAVDTPRVRFHY